jgi:hypothetical protein
VSLSRVNVPVSEPLGIPSWHLLPPLRPAARVVYLSLLDDAAAATLTRLTTTFASVHIVEPSYDRARRTHARAPALGDSRSAVICCTHAQLALAPGSIDLAVLEMAGTAARRRNRALHEVLRSLRHVLAPSGFLYVGVAASSRTPATSRRHALLARVLPGIQYRRLLTSAGFDAIRVWCAYPDSYDPKFLVECDQHVFTHFLTLLGRGHMGYLRATLRATVNRAGFLKHMAPAYSILARSGKLAAS